MEHQVICTNCGEKLVIPGHLEEFSCMYCGTRQTVIKEVSGDAQAAAEYYKAHILEVITDHRDIEKISHQKCLRACHRCLRNKLPKDF